MSKLIGFLREVSSHKMQILRDDGVYRHLRFMQSGTSECYFELITWPGYLTVTGDVGTWTFSRTNDMFDFFCGNGYSRNESLSINPSYWSEKFESGTGVGRYESPCWQFDPNKLDKALDEWLECWLKEEAAELEEDEIEEIKAKVADLKNDSYTHEFQACQAVEYSDLPGLYTFDIFEGRSMLRHSHHYVWICYAIVWGIERYRNKKLVDSAMTTFLNFLPVHAAIKG